MICELYNKFINFSLLFEDEFDISVLKKYFGNYINIKKTNLFSETSELTICFVSEKNHLFSGTHYNIDNHKMLFINNCLYVEIKNYEEDEMLFIKRLLIDLCNRFFEYKGGIFLHSSSIVHDNNTVVFFGQKGMGKTTSMLYLLNNFDFEYSSNERTGFMPNDDSVISYGSPSSINIRFNTLKLNESLKNKLTNCISLEKYDFFLKNGVPKDQDERFKVSFDDLKTNLGRKLCPVSNLRIMCNLLYTPSSFSIQRTNYCGIKEALNMSRIDGVFPQRSQLNDIFLVNPVGLESIFDNDDIIFYNIYQNGFDDNSKEIYKVLKKGLACDKNQKNIR